MADVFSLAGKIAIDYNDAVKGLEKVSTKADKAGDALDDIDGAADDAGNGLDSLGDDAGDAADGLGDAADAADDAGSDFDSMGDDAGDAADGLDDMEDAAGDAADAADDAGSSASDAASDFDSMGDSASGAASGLGEMESAASGADSSISGVDIALGTMVGNGISSAASGLGNLVKDTVSAGDTVDKMSQKVGMSTDSYQEWSYVMDLCGADSSNLKTSMKTMTGVIEDAANGSDSAAEKLAAVGLSVEDLDGLSQEQQFDLIVTALQDMEEGSERTTAATDLLGKSGTDMAAVFNLTADETQNLKDEAHDLGIVLDEETIQASADLNDQFTRVQGAVSGAAANMLKDLMPVIGDVCDWIIDALVPALADLVEWVSEKVVPKVKEMAKYFKDNVIPVFQDVAKFVTDKVVPALAEIADWIIQKGIPKLKELAKYIQDNVVPALKDIADWVVENVVPKLKELAEYIQDNVIPALKDIADWIMENVVPKLKELAEFINNNVVPALKNIAGFITDKVIPAIKDFVDRVVDLAKKIKEKFDDIKDTVKNAIDKVKETITSIRDAVEKVTDTLTRIRDKFKDTFDRIKDTVKNAIDRIKELFHFEVSLPNIKLPHFSISPSGWQLGDLLSGTIPSLGIQWYKQAMDDGMIMDTPTVFGYDGKTGNLLAGGEAGSETVVGTDNLMGMIGSAVAENNSEVIGRLDTLTNMIAEYLAQILENMGYDIRLNSGVLVGELVSDIDTELGKLEKKRNR